MDPGYSRRGDGCKSHLTLFPKLGNTCREFRSLLPIHRPDDGCCEISRLLAASKDDPSSKETSSCDTCCLTPPAVRRDKNSWPVVCTKRRVDGILRIASSASFKVAARGAHVYVRQTTKLQNQVKLHHLVPSPTTMRLVAVKGHRRQTWDANPEWVAPRAP